MTKDEYKVNQKDKNRIDGTTIGKQAIRDFVKGLKIRMDSSVTSIETKECWENNKFAVAFFYFYKWLVEVRDFDEICDEMINAPVMTAWVDKAGKMRCMQNWFSEEPKSIMVFLRIAKNQVKWYKLYYKIAKMRKRRSIEEKSLMQKVIEEI